MLRHDNSQTLWISAERPFHVDLREHYLPITIKQCEGHEYFVHLTKCSSQANYDILKEVHIRQQERDFKLFVKRKHSLKRVKQGIPSLFSIVSQAIKNLRYSRRINFGCSSIKPFLPNVFFFIYWLEFRKFQNTIVIILFKERLKVNAIFLVDRKPFINLDVYESVATRHLRTISSVDIFRA